MLRRFFIVRAASLGPILEGDGRHGGRGKVLVHNVTVNQTAMDDVTGTLRLSVLDYKNLGAT